MKSLRLHGAARRVVLGIEIEHDLLALELVERDRAAAVARQFEVGGAVPFGDASRQGVSPSCLSIGFEFLRLRNALGRVLDDIGHRRRSTDFSVVRRAASRGPRSSPPRRPLRGRFAPSGRGVGREIVAEIDAQHALHLVRKVAASISRSARGFGETIAGALTPACLDRVLVQHVRPFGGIGELQILADEFDDPSGRRGHI